MRRFSVWKLTKWGAFCCILALIGLATGVYHAGEAVSVTATTRKLPIYSVQTAEKTAALGFNCAWDNADIPRLIQILEQYQTKATFFVAGDWCDKYPQSVRNLAQAGHEIGSHSNTHTDLTKLNRAQIAQEITLCNEKITALTGQPVKWFRMPSGAYNNLVIETVRGHDMEPIQWDCDSLDYTNPTPAEINQHIWDRLQPGSILLFHSGAKNTPEALPSLLLELQADGYRLVPVSELVLPAPYRIDHQGRQHKA